MYRKAHSVQKRYPFVPIVSIRPMCIDILTAVCYILVVDEDNYNKGKNTVNLGGKI